MDYPTTPESESPDFNTLLEKIRISPVDRRETLFQEALTLIGIARERATDFLTAFAGHWAQIRQGNRNSAEFFMALSDAQLVHIAELCVLNGDTELEAQKQVLVDFIEARARYRNPARFLAELPRLLA
jgi:hypothetical protein